MEVITRKLALLHNLINTANDHKLYCKEECNVSLYMLKETALLITSHLKDKEFVEAMHLIAETKWS